MDKNYFCLNARILMQICHHSDAIRFQHITDLHGQEVHRGHLRAPKSSYGIAHLPSGAYILHIKEGNRTITQQKMVVK